MPRNEEEERVLFVCTECHSQRYVNPYQDIWVQEGVDLPPCKFCGGVTVYVEDPENVERVIESHMKKQGLWRD